MPRKQNAKSARMALKLTVEAPGAPTACQFFVDPSAMAKEVADLLADPERPQGTKLTLEVLS